MPKRIVMSSPKLKFMNDQEFEDEAVLLLAEYGGKHGVVSAPPIPIDDIVELYLKLRLTFDDMQQMFGVDDVHGALWVKDEHVGIDKRLDPTENPAMLGRYHFTLAHEAGHWRLHRHLFQRKANQLALLPEGATRPEYICRSSDTEPIEYQANRFASCVLMPREMVKRAWHEWRGDMEPIYLDDLRANKHEVLLAECRARGSFNNYGDSPDEMMLHQVSRPLAEKFEVSPDAMRIRLQGMKLLCEKKEPTLF